MIRYLLFFVAFAPSVFAGQPFQPRIPKAWDDAAVASSIVPLADPGATPVQAPAKYYYGIPARHIYKSYPVYRPDREPAGYIDWLKQQEPKIAFDAAKLKTQEDWIRAGEIVFDAPISYGHIFRLAVTSDLYLRLPDWYSSTGALLAKDGSLPFYRYVVREKGKVEIGVNSCGMCHTRVMPDGSMIKGAQGNFPFDRSFAWELRHGPKFEAPFTSFMARRVERMLYSAPWIHPDALPGIDDFGAIDIADRHQAIPPGVLARHGTSPLAPATVSDLIGVEDRRYLDSTGLIRHRDIGDLMRYAAMNQDEDVHGRYKDFVPAEALPFGIGKAPADPAKISDGRYSDEQLYALALYIYSLRPPANPNQPDALSASGKKVFAREGCAGCHTPPLYTNNKRTPALGYRPSPQDVDVVPLCLRTDPALALKTRAARDITKYPP
jgi:hypothetical protein